MKNPVRALCVRLFISVVLSACATPLQAGLERKPAGQLLYPGPWNSIDDGSYKQVHQSAIDETEIIQNLLLTKASKQKICSHLGKLSVRLQELAVLCTDPGNQKLYESVLSVEGQIAADLHNCEHGDLKGAQDFSSLQTTFYQRTNSENLPHSILSSMPVGI